MADGAALGRSIDPQLVNAYNRARERFEPDLDGCWLFTGAKNRAGYGNVRVGGTVMNIHRVSYLVNHGPLLEDREVRHKCDRPACFNPSHLEDGTKHDNLRDVIERGRVKAARFLNMVPSFNVVTDDECPF